MNKLDKRHWICLILICAVVMLSLGIGVGFGIFKATGSQDARTSSEAQSSGGHHRFSGWQTEACAASSSKCAKNANEMPLLLISLDGFRADYLKRDMAIAINRLIECGSHTPLMYPSYPSMTFPNHFTIVTGLYPESHGIVANNMMDPNLMPESDRNFTLGSKASLNSNWWTGEPIWNTVTKNGKKSAIFYWPGSEVEIHGLRPTIYTPFGSAPFTTRVDTIVGWLKNETLNASFLGLYFDEPDHTGHLYGPDSPEVSNQIVIVDAMINYLMYQLYKAKLLGCVNIIILADHGMADTSKPKLMRLSDYVRNTSGLLVYEGPSGRIQIEDSSRAGVSEDELLNSLVCKNENFRVYSRLTMPTRFHYSRSPRIGNIIVEPNAGFRFVRFVLCASFSGNCEFGLTKEGEDARTSRNGQHGYDHRHETMHALFLGYGPAFKQGLIVQPFQNIELYNLMTEVMHLRDRATNNGTIGALSHLLVNPEPIRRQKRSKSPACLMESKSLFCDACANQPMSDSSTEADCESSRMTPATFSADVSANLTPNDQLCESTLCATTAVYSRAFKVPLMIAYEMNKINRFPITENNDSRHCRVKTASDNLCSQANRTLSLLKAANLWLYSLLPEQGYFAEGFSNMVPMFTEFYEGQYFAAPFVDSADVWSKVIASAANYSRTNAANLLIIAGPVFDGNNDGVADSSESILQKKQSDAFSVAIPSHFYLIAITCNDSRWQNLEADRRLLRQCARPEVTSFVLPNRRKQVNHCQPINDLLNTHMATVRDVERLTGIEMFTDGWSTSLAMQLRTRISQRSWLLA